MEQRSVRKAVVRIAAMAVPVLLVLPAAVWCQSSAQGGQSSQGQQAQSQQQQQGQQGQQAQGQQGQQAQGQQQQQGQQGAQGQQSPPPAAPAVDPAEEAAYKQVTSNTVTDPKAVVAAGEDFLKKYPNSRYVGFVYARLTSAYYTLGDADKMIADGNKALELIPDNVDVLAIMAVATSRRIDPSQLDADQKMRATETYAKNGIMLMNQLQKPADANEEQWNHARDEKLAMCYSALGLVYLHRNSATEAVQALTEATKLENPPDPVDQYLLGVSLKATKDYANAITVLDACAKQDGPMQPRCKQELESVKKAAANVPKQ
jgi:tetratricopeptide (TPR) repeat protein